MLTRLSKNDLPLSRSSNSVHEPKSFTVSYVAVRLPRDHIQEGLHGHICIKSMVMMTTGKMSDIQGSAVYPCIADFVLIVRRMQVLGAIPSCST